MDQNSALQELVVEWLRNRPLGDFTVAKDPSGITVPDGLANTLTTHEPWRTQAIDDARLWLALPVMFGSGMSVQLGEAPSEVRSPWAAWLSPLAYRMVWPNSKSGGLEQGAAESLAAVVQEGDSWRIAAIFDEKSRANARNCLFLLRVAHP